VQWRPAKVLATGDVELTGNSNAGNKGLAEFSGDVYIHLGLITSKSISPDDWRYVLFTWGSREEKARATPVGKNKWKYSIPHIREFFRVPADEKIINIALLFRSGTCVDTDCRVLRNEDGSNMIIPVEDKTIIFK
jgi:hypothetical protein